MENAERPGRYDLTTFTIREMTVCGQAMRAAAAGATSIVLPFEAAVFDRPGAAP